MYDERYSKCCVICSIIFFSTDSESFTAARLTKFSLSLSYHPQYARDRHLISTYDMMESVLEVYEPSLEHSPLFVYKLPLTADHIQISDNVIMCTTILNGVKLVCLSSQMAEMAKTENQVNIY